MRITPTVFADVVQAAVSARLIVAACLCSSAGFARGY